jgi:23S rRNA pseudouridine1911/1915/1917 synthase
MQGLVVRFEDESLLVVEKPAGIHTAPLHAGEEGTLLGMVMEAYPEVRHLPGFKTVEPGLLHRLDRETSGLVVVARTAQAFQTLRAGFETMRKQYAAGCAIVEQPTADSFTVTSRFAPYGPGRRRVRVVTAEEKSPWVLEAATRDVHETTAHVLRRTEGRALVLVEITRGFRHQIRAHLSHAGLPLLGDVLYGRPVPEPFVQRMYLHAVRIGLRHPVTGVALVVESPLPPEFAALFGIEPAAGLPAFETGRKGATS